MPKQTTIHPPVFVRADDTTTIAACLVEWSDNVGGFSVRLNNGRTDIIINSADWPVLVACVNRELERVA